MKIPYSEIAGSQEIISTQQYAKLSDEKKKLYTRFCGSLVVYYIKNATIKK
jgi:hypothetical protein